MKARRLAFGNKARVGKDTAVNWLIEKYGGVKYSFAEAVYDIMYYAQKVCRFPQEKRPNFSSMDRVNIVKEKIEGTNPNVSM